MSCMQLCRAGSVALHVWSVRASCSDLVAISGRGESHHESFARLEVP